jgi:antitoxin MazE
MEIARLRLSTSETRVRVPSTLIDAYEAQHEPIDRPDPIEAIQFRIALQTSDGYTMESMYIYTEDAMQVSKWGNSLAVRLPAAVVDALGLKEGDQIEIQVAGKRLFDVAKSPSARELLARLRKFRGRLPATFKFDRLDANERR